MAEDVSPFHAQNQGHDPCACCEIAGELRDVATWLADGGLTADEFRKTLTMLEARKIARFGLTLTSVISEGHIAHFSLRFMDTEELCASMDVDLGTGTVSMQTTCA